MCISSSVSSVALLPLCATGNPIGLAGAHCLQNLSAFFWVDDIISVQESLSLLADFAGFVFGG